jgi:protein-S-isoprenylcysteine O-methyltransferase Ste14
MNIYGIGPRIAIVGGLSFIATVVLQAIFGLTMSLPTSLLIWLRLIGFVLNAVGLWFWFFSIIQIRRAFESHHLATKGVYSLSRNPMYSAFIVFIVPGLAFITNNLLILFISLCMFICFKLLIGKEEKYLQQEYGTEFEEYSSRVAQLIPFIHL